MMVNGTVIPTVAEYKAAQAAMQGMHDADTALPAAHPVFDVAWTAIDQAILFQEAWGEELASIQTYLWKLREFLREFALCEAARFPEFRVRLGEYLNDLDARLQAISRIKYSPTP